MVLKVLSYLAKHFLFV
jgi:hypothetical protein